MLHTLIKMNYHQRNRQIHFNQFLAPMPKIKKDLDALGIEIFNTSMESAINCFEKVPISKFL